MHRGARRAKDPRRITPKTAKKAAPRRLYPTTTHHTTSPAKNLKKTIKIIGQAIKKGSVHPPLRHHAAMVATRAKPKDYAGQLAALYADFLDNWRYVRDPLTMETVAADGNALWGLVYGADLPVGQKGFGDCDDAAGYLGAAARSIGFPVKIVTVCNPKLADRSLLTHVYVEAQLPNKQWIALDPVLHPATNSGPGAQPPQARRAEWNLDAQLLATKGHFPAEFREMLGGETPMHRFQDYGLEAAVGPIPAAGTVPQLDFSRHIMRDFGAYGFLGQYDVDEDSGEEGPLVEVTPEDEFQIEGLGGRVTVTRTKMLEMSPKEFLFMKRNKKPRKGAVALGDDGDVYQWYEEGGAEGVGQLGGFFKKIFKGIGKGLKWIGKKIKKGVRWVVSKLPGGKWLLKMFDKLKKIAMKIVKPLMKVLGPLAKKFAPMAAMIPGFGPAISGALTVVGKISDITKKFGVGRDKKGMPKFKSDKHAKEVRASMVAEAAKMKASGKAKTIIADWKAKGGKMPTGKQGAIAAKTLASKTPVRLPVDMPAITAAGTMPINLSAQQISDIIQSVSFSKVAGRAISKAAKAAAPRPAKAAKAAAARGKSPKLAAKVAIKKRASAKIAKAKVIKPVRVFRAGSKEAKKVLAGLGFAA